MAPPNVQPHVSRECGHGRPTMASLNRWPIGEEREAALKAEADLRGLPVAIIVREGFARARTGFADEAQHLDQHGLTLTRFRRARSSGA